MTPDPTPEQRAALEKAARRDTTKQFPEWQIACVSQALCCPDGCSERREGRPCLRDTGRVNAWDVLYALDQAGMLIPSPLHVAVRGDDLRYLSSMIGTAEARAQDVANALKAQREWIEQNIPASREHLEKRDASE